MESDGELFFIRNADHHRLHQNSAQILQITSRECFNLLKQVFTLYEADVLVSEHDLVLTGADIRAGGAQDRDMARSLFTFRINISFSFIITVIAIICALCCLQQNSTCRKRSSPWWAFHLMQGEHSCLRFTNEHASIGFISFLISNLKTNTNKHYSKLFNSNWISKKKNQIEKSEEIWMDQSANLKQLYFLTNLYE